MSDTTVTEFINKPMIDAQSLNVKAFERFNDFMRTLRTSYTDLYLTTLEYDSVCERESQFSNDVRLVSDFLDIIDREFLDFFMYDFECEEEINRLRFLLKFHTSMRKEYKHAIYDYGTCKLLNKVVQIIYVALNDNFEIVYAS